MTAARTETATGSPSPTSQQRGRQRQSAHQAYPSGYRQTSLSSSRRLSQQGTAWRWVLRTWFRSTDSQPPGAEIATLTNKLGSKDTPDTRSTISPSACSCSWRVNAARVSAVVGLQERDFSTRFTRIRRVLVAHGGSPCGVGAFLMVGWETFTNIRSGFAYT